MKSRKLKRRLHFPIIAELLCDGIHDVLTVEFNSLRSGKIVKVDKLNPKYINSPSCYGSKGVSYNNWLPVTDKEIWKIIKDEKPIT
jgi:hypothetical protein